MISSEWDSNVVGKQCVGENCHGELLFGQAAGAEVVRLQITSPWHVQSKLLPCTAPPAPEPPAQVRELFQMARAKKACIIFFDEVGPIY